MWASFVIKVVAKNFQKSPNLVTLLKASHWTVLLALKTPLVFAFAFGVAREFDLKNKVSCALPIAAGESDVLSENLL